MWFRPKAESKSAEDLVRLEFSVRFWVVCAQISHVCSTAGSHGFDVSSGVSAAS